MIRTDVRTISRMLALTAAAALAVGAAGAPASAAPSPSHPAPVVAAGSVRPPTPVPPGRATRLAPAATNQDGVCHTDELCLWFLTNFQGSLSDFAFTTPHLAGFRYLSAGTGKGAQVTNNSESVFNTDDTFAVSVCQNDNLVGPCGVLQPGQSGNFANGYANNVESFNFTFLG
jgi:hypothetical protein